MSITGPGIVKRGNLYFADPRAIKRREGWNPRFDFGDLQEEKETIKAGGVLNPLRVKRKDDGFELIDGDRRLTAIEMLLEDGVTFPDGVPVIVVPKDQDDITSKVQMFVANRGKPFLPLEAAATFRDMKAAGMTLDQIHQRCGVSMTTIVQALALIESDGEVQDAVVKGEVTATEAKAIAVAARGDKEKQKELVQAVKAAGGDKKARRAANRAVEKVRVQKAASKGRRLKMKQLDADQLSAMGLKVAKQLEEALHDAGTDDVKLMKQVASDNLLAAAFSLGAIKALRAAAGLKEVLTV